MSDYQIRRNQHTDKLLGLYAELRGYITGVLKAHDEGAITPEQALTHIREKHEKTATAVEAAWDEYTGSAR